MFLLCVFFIVTENGFDVMGIDISKTAINIAGKKSRVAKAKIDFFCESFVDLSFVDGEFDFVFDMVVFTMLRLRTKSSS